MSWCGAFLKGNNQDLENCIFFSRGFRFFINMKFISCILFQVHILTKEFTCSIASVLIISLEFS